MMDNSLATYKRKVEEMIYEIEGFSAALNHHVIIEPRDVIEDAIRAGLPLDIASQYLQEYYSRNETDAQNIIRYINNTCIPYLRDVAFYIESAMNVGNSNVRDKGIGPQNLGSSPIRRPADDLAYRTYQLIKRDEAFRKNNLNLEKALGIKQGAPMSIAEADKQKANPNYKTSPEYIRSDSGEYVKVQIGENSYEFINLDEWMKRGYSPSLFEREVKYKKNPYWMYSINCATCAAAYALRLRGFDITAKGNPKIEGNRNTWLSEGNSFKIWKNDDGSQAKPAYYRDWMKEQGKTSMTSSDYKDFFEEKCKEEGVYIVTVAWKGNKEREYGGGHATILQRDKEGLHYIEPQVYKADKTQDGRMSIDYLIKGMSNIQPFEKGVMRVDDKIFDTKYVDLFNVNK